MKFIDDYFIQKSNFILNDTLKVDVLKHSSIFSKQKEFKFSEGLLNATSLTDSLLIPHKNNKKNKSTIDKNTWNKFQKEGWTNAAGKSGIILLESVMMAAYEIFYLADSNLALQGAFTRELIKLLERHGSAKLNKLLLPALNSGAALGVPILDDNVSLSANPNGDIFNISGKLENIFYFNPKEDLNIIQLVSARIDQETIGVFAIPYYQLNKKVNNKIEVLDPSEGSENWFVGTLNYQESTGFLLTTLASPSELSDLFLDELNHQLSIFSVASIARLIITENAINKPSNSKKDIAIAHSDFKSTLYATYEGLKGAVLSSSFKYDCKLYAGEAQADHFIDAHKLTSIILKLYSSNIAFDLIKQGINHFGLAMYSKNFDLLQQIHNVTAVHSLGNKNANLAQLAIEKLVQNEGKLISSIISDYQTIDTHQANSPQLRSAIGIWLEYVGGIILLQDDMTNDKDFTSWQLFAERYTLLLGNIIVAYHLIQQALESERQMEQMGVNFFNISLEIEKNETVELLFQNVLLAEHFVHNVLTLQERQIRILQKKSGILF
jgi:hypothetical protein